MMRRIELQDLLPAGTFADRPRSEVLQGLRSASVGEASAPSGGGPGGPSAATDSLSGLLQRPAKDVTEQISVLTSQITTLNATQQAHIGVLQDNTQAITQNTSAKNSGSSVGSVVGNLASTLLGGLSLSPIIGGLVSLLGGRDGQSSASAASPFRLPAAVQFDAGLTTGWSGQVVPVSFGAEGQARPQVSSPAPQITVQVNAMDSQSFLDHSDEIARAVREALLGSNSLNDVISDL